VALAARGLGLEAILALGDEAQQQRLFPRFTASDGWRRAAALAYAERGGPLDGFGTRAVRAGDGWVLDGKKCFVSGAEGAELVVVFAQVEGDGWPHVGAFVVEKGTVGLTVGPRQRLLGLEASPVYELTLDGCRVGDEGRLCGGGDFMAAARGLFSRLGLLQAARQVGLARASYENALEYTQERKAFGKPVAHFQSIAFALADMHMDVEAARWMVWKAATSGQAEDIAAAVAHANEAAWRVADLGVQLLGGAGFVKDFPAEKWLRDTRALSLHAPPSECATLGIAAAELGQAIDGLPSTGIQPFVT
jgi:acyl-CoA dehydrogenase